jgi:hypothetical protein
LAAVGVDVHVAIAERTGTEAERLPDRGLGYRFTVDGAAPARVRDALEGDLDEIDAGAALALTLLARALVASCVRGEGGTVRVGVRVGADQVRLEVSGGGPGFRLPLGPHAIESFALDDDGAPPPGWRAYLIDRLADAWGVDEEAGVVWVEVDHVTAAARRLQRDVARN